MGETNKRANHKEMIPIACNRFHIFIPKEGGGQHHNYNGREISTFVQLECHLGVEWCLCEELHLVLGSFS